MGKKKNKNSVPKFFSLPQSKRVSFKVPTKKTEEELYNSDLFNDVIPPRGDYQDAFYVDENSSNGRPRNFTPEQTYNYKSAWKRYEKGLKLAQEGKLIKDGDDEYKCISPHAPKGYWEVKKKNSGGGELPEGLILPEWKILIGDEYFEPGVTSGYDSATGTYTATVTYSKYFEDSFGENILIIAKAGAFYDGSIITINSSLTTNHEYGGMSLVNGCYFDVVSTTFPNFDYIDNTIESGLPESNGTPSTIINNSEFAKSESTYAGFVIEGGVTSRGDSFPANFDLQIEVQVEIKLFGSDGGDGDDDSEGDGGDGDGSNNDNWECDCPDSSKKKAPNPNDTSDDAGENNWSDSDAGAPGGICKHIWAVRIARGEVLPGDIPSDIPIESWDSKIQNSSEPRVIGGNGGIGFPNWNSNKQVRRKDA